MRARKIASFVAMLERGETLHPNEPKRIRSKGSRGTKGGVPRSCRNRKEQEDQ
jgi:hypothetical protein